MCHWNLDSVTDHSYVILFLLRAYITIHNSDIICLSETYHDSSTPIDYENLEIAGYSLLRLGYISYVKRGGMCVYYKNFLILRIVNIECIRFGIKTTEILYSLVVLYKSASQ